jgi:hypothetical protein
VHRTGTRRRHPWSASSPPEAEAGTFPTVVTGRSRRSICDALELEVTPRAHLFLATGQNRTARLTTCGTSRGHDAHRVHYPHASRAAMTSPLSANCRPLTDTVTTGADPESILEER